VPEHTVRSAAVRRAIRLDWLSQPVDGDLLLAVGAVARPASGLARVAGNLVGDDRRARRGIYARELPTIAALSTSPVSKSCLYWNFRDGSARDVMASISGRQPGSTVGRSISGACRHKSKVDAKIEHRSGIKRALGLLAARLLFVLPNPKRRPLPHWKAPGTPASATTTRRPGRQPTWST